MLNDLTAEQVRELLNYDQETGVFTWRVYRASNAKIGDVAGTYDAEGYRQIRIAKRGYKSHRLAWLYVYGKWPIGDIDHINRNTSDNRIANLREATRSENLQNTGLHPKNTSGLKGVSWHKSAKKWRARITANGIEVGLGLFKTPEAAYSAYCDAAANMHARNPVAIC